MTPAINLIWSILENVKEIYSDNSDISIDTSSEKKDSFEKSFKTLYKSLMVGYMDESVRELDRHKVASIIICTIISEQIVTSNKKTDPDTEIFLGSEMIALSIGLSYMQRALNDALRKRGIHTEITGFSMPVAMTCKTDYFDIFARNLYFANKDFKLNPLDISDKLFLIEYLTLKDRMIDPRILIESEIKDAE